MSGKQNDLFYISKEEAKSLIYIAFLAGEFSGKAKAYTSELMSQIGKGISAEAKGIDANRVIQKLSFVIDNDRNAEEIINDLSNTAQQFLDKCLDSVK